MTPTIPSHAARIWLENNSIHLDLPAVGSLLSHRLTFPNDAYGMARALVLLRQRTAMSKIGEPGDLTQWQMDKLITHDKCKKTFAYDEAKVKKVKPKDEFAPALRQGARDVLRRLGLT
jgi:hypothetical protein